MITEDTLFNLLTDEQREDIIDAYYKKLKKVVSELEVKIELDENDLESVKDWVLDSLFEQLRHDEQVSRIMLTKIRVVFNAGESE